MTDKTERELSDELERARTAAQRGTYLTDQKCTSDDPNDHQGDTCPVHEADEQTTHTPGPWHVSGSSIVAESAVTVAQVLPGTDAGTPNARLIAAAPDLLDAALQVIDCWERHGNYVAPEDIASVRAAVRKAVGDDA